MGARKRAPAMDPRAVCSLCGGKEGGKEGAEDVRRMRTADGVRFKGCAACRKVRRAANLGDEEV